MSATVATNSPSAISQTSKKISSKKSPKATKSAKKPKATSDHPPYKSVRISKMICIISG